MNFEIDDGLKVSNKTIQTSYEYFKHIFIHPFVSHILLSDIQINKPWVT